MGNKVLHFAYLAQGCPGRLSNSAGCKKTLMIRIFTRTWRSPLPDLCTVQSGAFAIGLPCCSGAAVGGIYQLNCSGSCKPDSPKIRAVENCWRLLRGNSIVVFFQSVGVALTSISVVHPRFVTTPPSALYFMTELTHMSHTYLQRLYRRCLCCKHVTNQYYAHFCCCSNCLIP
jgi:hypothetical protein